ncbi:hypothetical protein QCA50_013563 [Cerrena zonata]|uniref:Uncharacterized protein n=1 Tax=Cerrena zonata TaxID=2478898 RepID=A0AAW0FR96_9APHY
MIHLIYDGHHSLDPEKLNAHIQPLEEAEAVTAETKVCAELDRKRDAMKEEVRQLAAHALSIEQSFDNILHNLKNAKATEKMSEELVEDTNKLIDRWKELQEAFREQVWKSKDFAGKARIAAEDFANVFIEKVLKDPSLNIPGMKTAIHEYAENLNDDTKHAQDLVDGFRDLAKDVNAFRSTWEQVIKRHKLDLNTTPSRISIRILLSYQMAIDTISTAVGIFSLASNALSVISTICPSGWHKSATTIPTPAVHGPLKKASIKQGEKERKLEKLKQSRERKIAELRSLEALDACLSESKETFEVITTRLGKFAAVWGSIQGDLRATEEYLHKAEGTDTDKPFQRTMFDARINSARELYIVLADIFREYQVAVDAECKIFKSSP